MLIQLSPIPVYRLANLFSPSCLPTNRRILAGAATAAVLIRHLVFSNFFYWSRGRGYVSEVEYGRLMHHRLTSRASLLPIEWAISPLLSVSFPRRRLPCFFFRRLYFWIRWHMKCGRWALVNTYIGRSLRPILSTSLSELHTFFDTIWTALYKQESKLMAGSTSWPRYDHWGHNRESFLSGNPIDTMEAVRSWLRRHRSSSSSFW